MDAVVINQASRAGRDLSEYSIHQKGQVTRGNNGTNAVHLSVTAPSRGERRAEPQPAGRC